jgi:hypothetical protein
MSALKGCIELCLCGTQSQRGNSCFVLLAQYCAGDKIKKNEMGGACSTYGGEERRIQGFGGET